MVTSLNQFYLCYGYAYQKPLSNTTRFRYFHVPILTNIAANV